MTGIQQGFQDVDSQESEKPFATYLRTLSDVLAQQKAMTLELLEPVSGSRLLDVGCGTGTEVAELAATVGPNGRVTGIDLSQDLIRLARTAYCQVPCLEFLVCDAHELPWPDNVFDGARVERTLQHVAEPSTVLADMFRVVKPRGKVVVSEPDWDSLLLDSSSPAASRRVAEAICKQIRNPHIGRQVVGCVSSLGFEVIRVVPTTLIMRSFPLAENVLSLGEVAPVALLDELHERDCEGRFFASITGFTVVAVG